MDTNSVFFETAWSIGLDLVRDAIWDKKGRCNWVGNFMDPVEGQFTAVVRSFGADFYSGTAGIVYFLLALHAEKPDDKLKETIDGAIAQMLSKMQALPDHGFYSGKPGNAYVLVKAGDQFNNQEWIDAGLGLLNNLKSEGITPYETDMISGIAGTIPVLLQLAKKYKKDDLQAQAVKLGDILCAIARREQVGYSWDTGQSTRSLTGFSHGAAGMATTLLDLYAATGDKKYHDFAMKGFEYEQWCYDPTEQNWPDLRDSMGPLPPKPINGMAWCHGAPGIALSRIFAYKVTGEKAMADQAAIAMATTHRGTMNLFANPAMPPNYSLCHGAAGNTDILLDADNGAYYEFAKSVGMYGIQAFEKPRIPWISGVNNNKKTPGLMMGLAGVGYFYLRLFDKNRFKSVLIPNELSR